MYRAYVLENCGFRLGVCWTSIAIEQGTHEFDGICGSGDRGECHLRNVETVF